MNPFEQADAFLTEQFGRDVPMSLATGRGDEVSVRVVDCYYEHGKLFVTSHSQSLKARQIAENPKVAVCRDLFRATGTAVNLGNPLLPQNKEIRETLKRVFVAFYERHVNEADPGTCILRIDLEKAEAYDPGHRYSVNFKTRIAEVVPCVNDIMY